MTGGENTTTADSAKGKHGNPLTKEFAEFVHKTLDEWHVPGVSIAVVDGEDVYAEGYGFAELPDTPATPNTIWYGASTTKAFTAALVAHLIDTKASPLLARGWQTPIASLIPDDFVLEDAWATTHLTLEDAVCHRSGMPRHDVAVSRVDEQGRQTSVRDQVRNLRHLPLSREPRVKFQYCNLMFVVLSHVVETVMGRALGEVMREVVWEPLGMRATYLDLEEARAGPDHFAAGYYWDDEADEYRRVPDMSVVEISGAGGQLSNVLDYAQWIKCLLHQTAPFSKAVHEDIRTPRFVAGKSEIGPDLDLYGLGWERTVYHGHVMYSHAGGMHAFGSDVFWFPDAKFGITMFGNTCLTANAVGKVLLYKLAKERLGICEETKDPAEIWRGLIKKFTDNFYNAVDLVYPERPNPPIPSPLSIRDLAGTYYHPGYKYMRLKVAPHPDKKGEEILVADRTDMSWKFDFSVHHVSGTFWILYLIAHDNPIKFFREYEKAEFKIGPDGKAHGLEVEWWSRLSNIYNGVTTFKKLD